MSNEKARRSDLINLRCLAIDARDRECGVMVEGGQVYAEPSFVMGEDKRPALLFRTHVADYRVVSVKADIPSGVMVVDEEGRELAVEFTQDGEVASMSTLFGLAS